MDTTKHAIRSKRRGPTKSGLEKRKSILMTAMQMASEDGLDALTIGNLASELDMSKSGLFGLFGSKKKLQLETINAAREIFIEEVVTPAIEKKSGIEMLSALIDLWFSYVERGVFNGGCFFATATHEYKNKEGQVRNALAENMQDWLDLLYRIVRKAQREGDLEREIEAKQIAFEINAISIGANWERQLYDRPEAFTRGRWSTQRLIESLATSKETKRKIKIC